jgi:trehalose 6-phosphate phosphatase
MALVELADVACSFEGATIKAGSAVVEAFARHTDKGTTLMALASDLGAVTAVFLGDDLTDEDAFVHLSPGDVAVKVGDADTIATHRLRDPAAVLAFLRALVTPATPTTPLA